MHAWGCSLETNCWLRYCLFFKIFRLVYYVVYWIVSSFKYSPCETFFTLILKLINKWKQESNNYYIIIFCIYLKPLQVLAAEYVQCIWLKSLQSILEELWASYSSVQKLLGYCALRYLKEISPFCFPFASLPIRCNFFHYTAISNSYSKFKKTNIFIHIIYIFPFTSNVVNIGQKPDAYKEILIDLQPCPPAQRMSGILTPCLLLFFTF